MLNLSTVPNVAPVEFPIVVGDASFSLQMRKPTRADIARDWSLSVSAVEGGTDVRMVRDEFRVRAVVCGWSDVVEGDDAKPVEFTDKALWRLFESVPGAYSLAVIKAGEMFRERIGEAAEKN